MKGHIAKKGDRFYVVVYIDGKPKWHSIPLPPGIKTDGKEAKKIAESYRIELLHKIDNNAYVDAKNMTFESLLNKWLDSRDLAPKTHYRYKEIIDLHLTPALGNVRLDKLQPLHIQNYYKEAQEKGRIGRKNSSRKGLSGTTVLQHHRIIHCALHQAIMWGLVTRNVADAVIPPRKEKRVLFEPTLDQIFEVFDKIKDDIIYMPSVLALSTGARRGEALGERWKDLTEFYDEESEMVCGRISIVQTLQRVPGKGLKFQPPKTPGSRRVVELPATTVIELNRHKTLQDELKTSLGDTYQDNDLICCWNDGRPIDPDYITKRFESITAQLGYPDFRFHDLRHAHATFLLAAGVDSKIIQERLGHSTVSFTLDQYSHVIPSMQHKAAVKADEIFFNRIQNGKQNMQNSDPPLEEN